MKQLWIKYRYWVIATFIIVWMMIFDSNNIVDLIKIRSSINELEDKKEFYSNEIDTLRKEEKALFSNIKNLEKFAREKYLMKKDNEDIFVIIE